MKTFTAGLALHVVTAISGLGTFVLIASFLEWITPVWWGGKAFFLPLIGMCFLGAAAVPTAIVLYVLSRREQRRGSAIRWPFLGYVATGFLNGALCLPVGFLGAAVASEWGVNAVLGAASAFVVSIAASVLLFRPHVRPSHAS